MVVFRLAAILLLGIYISGVTCAEERPNIVFFFADDLGYGELGCQGNPQIPTPNIDRLAETGIRFTQGYVAASYCSASRAGLMTGRYPARFGYDNNPTGARNADPRYGLPATETTIARRLLDNGYATALIGKWHLGAAPICHPLRRGFSEFFGFLHEGHFYAPPPFSNMTTMLRRRSLPPAPAGQSSKTRWVSSDGHLILSNQMGHNEPAYDANNPILRGGQPVVETEYLTDAITREAIDFVNRHLDRPFFLYVAFNAVHSPLQAPHQIMRRFESSIPDVQRRIFAAMLTSMDESIGAIVRRIDEAGLSDRTLLVFISDNGGPTRELTSSNLPLRGGKGDLYEGGVRVPFMLRWTHRLPAGRVEDRPVMSLDVTATAAAVAGCPFTDDRQVDGVDLLPYLSGQNSTRPRQRLFWRMHHKAALRDGDWKLVRNRREPNDKWELFDLSRDPLESTDLADSRPQLRDRLIATWRNLNSNMQPPAIVH